MAFPQQFTVIAATKAAFSTGTADFGAVAMLWSLFVVGNPSTVQLTITASEDGVNYAPVSPSEQHGSFYRFNTPARYITAAMAQTGVTAHTQLFAEAMS